jgi:hypothetical protein
MLSVLDHEKNINYNISHGKKRLCFMMNNPNTHIPINICTVDSSCAHFTLIIILKSKVPIDQQDK